MVSFKFILLIWYETFYHIGILINVGGVPLVIKHFLLLLPTLCLLLENYQW